MGGYAGLILGISFRGVLTFGYRLADHGGRMAKDDFRFKTELRVRWPECDAQGIVYNGSYMDYLEVGQADYFRNLGFSIYGIARKGYFDSAVVKATMEFKSPAYIENILELYVRVSHIGNTSFTIDTEIYHREPDRLVASTQVVYVGYDAATASKRPMPQELKDIIQHYEETGEVLTLGGFPGLRDAAES